MWAVISLGEPGPMWEELLMSHLAWSVSAAETISYISALFLFPLIWNWERYHHLFDRIVACICMNPLSSLWVGWASEWPPPSGYLGTPVEETPLQPGNSSWPGLLSPILGPPLCFCHCHWYPCFFLPLLWAAGTFTTDLELRGRM